MKQLGASPQGLTSDEALERLRRYGPNSLARENRLGAVSELFRLLGNPLVLILLAAGAVSATFGDRVGAAIIITMVVASVLLNFFQEYQARHTVEKLRQHVASTASTVRNGIEQEVAVTDLVPGDIISLNAGSLVPADARLLRANDLFLRESALTGESLPSEKAATDLVGGPHGITDAVNAVFMGTAVQSGIGRALVVHTGRATAFGDIAAKVIGRSPETEFDRGIRRFGTLITRVIMLLVLFVFLVNIVFKRPILESFLFAIALAVGMTPELLPMIMTITLSRGAKRMAKKKVIVKQLASIENFGSIEILCSDKTGTLTMGEVALEQHVNVVGEGDDRVLQHIYINSFFEAGVRNPLDDAILRHPHPDIHEFTKIDEIPFDFERRRLSVVTERAGIRTLITKGAAEDVFQVCSTVDLGGQVRPFDEELRKTAETTYRKLSDDGFRVLGVAVKTVAVQQAYEKPDETAMTLIGFAAFLDPTKEGVSAILQDLKHDGIAVLIMTGDNEHVTRKTARDVGLPVDRIIVGTEMDAMDDAALAAQAEKGAIFARVAPGQKNRVITALKARGWVVGFLGDGINDAPSLHTADIGISVMNA
ncbi:MAG TPA: HAD-IC family P-type ATPase, partial [Armatimonadota bacterium]